MSTEQVYRDAIIHAAKAWMVEANKRKPIRPDNVEPALWVSLTDDEKLFVLVHERMHELFSPKAKPHVVWRDLK